MKKLLACVVVLSLSAAATVSGGGRKAPPTFSGSWSKVGGIINGKKIPAEVYQNDGYELRFKEDMYSEAIMGKFTEGGTFRIDASKNPATIDFTVTHGKEQGKTQLGIFKIEGDVMTLALALHGNPNRPRNFEGSGNLVVSILKRNR